MERQVFSGRRWEWVVAIVCLLVFALMLPVAALLGYRPTGVFLVVAIPVVLLPIGAWAAWWNLVRPSRVEFDHTGLAVVQGARRFALPWHLVRRVGVVREGEQGVVVSVLVAWPSTEPAPGSYEPQTLGRFVSGRPGSFAPAVYDPSLRGFILASRSQFDVLDDEVASAVERYAPGLWEAP